MPAQFDSRRDSFDQWLSQILLAEVADAQPSAQVWQRIIRVARSSLVLWGWRRRESALPLPSWTAWYEHCRRPMDLQWLSMGWWSMYPRLMMYT